MRGENCFSVADANKIRQLLKELRQADRTEQKKLRDVLRGKYRFYITDFDTSGSGFTVTDFDNLVNRGRITIRNDGSMRGDPCQ